MRNKIILISALSLTFILISATLINKKISLQIEEGNKKQVLLQLLEVVLEQNAYLELSIDDDFSNKAFDMYVERIDFGKKYLIKEDSAILYQYRSKIDDELHSGTFELYEKSLEIIDKRLADVKSIYTEVLKKPFDFEKEEKLYFDDKDFHYANNKEELKDIWRKYLKYRTLTRLNSMLESQNEAKEKNDTSVKIYSFDENEAKAREKVLTFFNDWYKRIEKIKEADRFETYVNCIVNVYGPHTSYFAPKNKEDFDIRMSGQLEGIGAQLQEKDGYITVMRIVPGSPSALQGDLEAKDKILKVKQQDSLPVDVVDMNIDDVVKQIRGKKGTTVTLTVKKINGSIEDISIVRDIVVLEETFAKSLVIPVENKKYGYINLPSFYVDFNNANGRKCSDDVKKEILKLKEENVDGIIFDVRNNGGGSLQDVIDITGFFISSGPVVQVKSRIGSPTIYRDVDPSVIYDGPLIVMVNDFSASASEILAAAIQDYKRGIVIGSKHTFGKGTVQRFVELDRFAPTGINDLGALKLTLQKFYRINGGSTQLKGVTPDVVLPDVYSYIDVGEKELEHPMPWDKIEKVNYQEFDNKKLFTELSKSSQVRIINNKIFTEIDKSAKDLSETREENSTTLNLNKYQARLKENEEKTAVLDSLEKTIPKINLNNLKVDVTLMGNDTSKIDRNKNWMKGLEQDIYLQEAINILNEWK